MIRTVYVLVGPIGGGKDHFFINNKSSEKTEKIQLRFAKKINDLAWTILGWEPKSNEEYEEFKRSKIKIVREHNFYNKILTDFSGRQLLINIAEGFKKEYGEDYWALSLFSKEKFETLTDIHQSKNIVDVYLTDVRFTYEIDVIFQVFNRLVLKDFDDDVRIRYCHYNNPKLLLKPDVESEKLACYFSDKKQDGDIIEYSEIREYENAI